MNTKTKSTLVLIGVLLIGIVIGALGSSMIRRSMWEERVARFRSPEGFSERLVHIIKPDPAQEEKVRQILLKHHDKMEKITEASRAMIKLHADSLLIDLQPVLNPDQLARLKDILHRRSRPAHRREHHEPPPPPDNEQ
jgi:hypothetical protein